MKKRKFIQTALWATTGITVAPSLVVSACKDASKEPAKTDSPAPTAQFALPEIPYGYQAFPETIDSMTMEIHHSKHHQGYTNNLNKAIAELGIGGTTIEEILSSASLPDAIRNNGGGYYNHSLYWDILTPGGGPMSDQLTQALSRSFGSPEACLNELADAGAKRFGSGWAWLCQGSDRELFVCSTPNQDNPLMAVAERKGTPLLGIDVWEHAYYLKYQNKRGEYLQNILKIIHWGKVAGRMA